MIHRDLIVRARGALGPRRQRPKAIAVRRAVSDAYYAVFHALCHMCANSLVGATKSREQAWRRVYRGIDHGRTRDELGRQPVQALHPDLPRFAAIFRQLQLDRHQADYDPAPLNRGIVGTRALVDDAETALRIIDGLLDEVRRELSAILITKPR